MRSRRILLTVVGILCALFVAGASWYVLRSKARDSDQPPVSHTETDGKETQPAPTDEPEGQENDAHGNSDEEQLDDDSAQQLPWGPTAAHLDAAQEAVSNMSSSELAGQVIIAHWTGTDPEVAEKLIGDYHLAGIILMGGNIDGSAQINEVSDGVQNEQQNMGRAWPAIVAVDQEGGRVARLANVIDPVPAFAELAKRGDEEVEEIYGKMGKQMAQLGFTMDFAPVADVSIGAQDPIGDRAAGTDVKQAAAAVRTAVNALISNDVIAVIKHFPGHGSVTTDSHVEVPIQQRDLKTLRENDFVPFKAAVADGAPVVMMGHIALQEIDPNTPATLSPAVYRLLRDELDFEGVIVTDAMNMAAITNNTLPGQETVAALAAGADLVLMPPDTVAAHEGVVVALESGELEREQVEESAARVVALQMWQSELRAEN